ncbi:hypothetical protein BaRGS_00021529 [Batillaria attramentaria]|uniref:Uncharacterized protein n=1 Tax=Batillaria attramentaria TaxID=370345 RepID=A0ABD0KJK6_9CAEN
MTNFERKHGAQGLGVPFFFWLLTSLCGIIPLYTIIKLEMHKHEELYFTATVMSFVLQVTSLCLTFFVNRLPCHSEPNAKVPCPETTCSFPSFLNFWWMTKMVVIGYKRDLTESDLWQLNRSEQSDTLVPVFERAWREESKGPKTTNLLLVLAKMFWWDLLVCFIFKVISDVIFFLSPVFLNLLMQFLSEEKAGRDWQGYVLCLGLFLSCSVKAVFFGHSLFRATRVGIRIKSVLIAAIYKKVLTMNNVTRNRVTAGEIVNMMSVDAQQIMEQMDLVFFGITTPIQVIVAALLLYQVIGWAVLVGVAVLVLQVPINGLIARKEKEYREANLTCKDKRVKLFNEILNAIKVLKLYAWEPSFREKIRHIRKKELSYLFKKVHVNSVMGLIWDMAPYLVTLATFATFILSDREHQLTATDAFVSLAFFNILRAPLNRFATIIVFTIQCFVSIVRINKFLDEEELDMDNVNHDDTAVHAISITNGNFKWDRHSRTTLKNINLTVGEGRLVAVVGPVGCGKSSLISAMLGEMERTSGTVNTKGSIAYVPQQAWMQNATVRDNILFGRRYHKAKYMQVLEQCQLERDLEILPAGDQTEIGEKGINLSGGQKQRVSVARAVYSDSDVYLLDDPLSAVDSHVGKAIFKQVIGHTGALKKKIIVMNDGKISERGSYEELISHDGPFAHFLNTYLTEAQANDTDPEIAAIRREMKERLEKSLEATSSMESVDSSVDIMRKKGTGSLTGRRKSLVDSLTASLVESLKTGEHGDQGRITSTETVEKGKVKAKVFGDFLRAAGVTPLVVSFIAYCAFQAMAVTANFLLDEWAEDPVLQNVTDRGTEDYNDQNDFYLTMYGVYGIAQVIFLAVFNWLYWTRMVYAAREMHARLANRILHYPMSFFDTTPSGRILNRVSLLLPVFVFYYLCQKFYIPTSRQLKRIESVTRTPIYVTLCETLSGAASIRAYRAVERFLEKAKVTVDENQVYFFASHGAVRWLQWNLDILASVVIFAAAIFEVVSPQADDGSAGLSVSYALQLSGTLIWMTRDICDFETYIVSVERLKEYSELETEAEWIVPSKRPPSFWPDKGEVIFKNFQTRYREGLDLVLKGVSFTIPAGERVGIVGRTGAGKTSLTLSLFRLVEAVGGSIVIDDINIANMGLHDLRCHLTILPQEPVLFSGTLRMNLDPFDEYNDAQLWTALDRAHLRPAVESMPGELYFHCGEEGSNLSVGQRQLVCLARTLLRRTKILVLDEATAAVDMETDALIQNTIRSAFSTSTVITIAHRLNTIMDYDRILVMDAGEVVEYAPPQELLADEKSAFYSMAKDAGLV